MVNLALTGILVNLTLRDTQGAEYSYNVNLAAGQQFSRFVTEILPNVPDGFAGTLQITATPFLPFLGSQEKMLAVTIVEFGPQHLSGIPLKVLFDEFVL